MGRDCGFCHIVEVDLPLHLSLAPLEFANHLNRKKILLFPCMKKKTLNAHLESPPVEYLLALGVGTHDEGGVAISLLRDLIFFPKIN